MEIYEAYICKTWKDALIYGALLRLFLKRGDIEYTYKRRNILYRISSRIHSVLQTTHIERNLGCFSLDMESYKKIEKWDFQEGFLTILDDDNIMMDIRRDLDVLIYDYLRLYYEKMGLDYEPTLRFIDITLKYHKDYDINTKMFSMFGIYSVICNPSWYKPELEMEKKENLTTPKKKKNDDDEDGDSMFSLLFET